MRNCHLTLPATGAKDACKADERAESGENGERRGVGDNHRVESAASSSFVVDGNGALGRMRQPLPATPLPPFHLKRRKQYRVDAANDRLRRNDFQTNRVSEMRSRIEERHDWERARRADTCETEPRCDRCSIARCPNVRKWGRPSTPACFTWRSAATAADSVRAVYTVLGEGAIAG